MLNFSYGSNMLTARIRERVSSAEFKGVARLRGHALRWHKRSIDGSGKCNIVRAEEDSWVYGVVYEISDEQMPALDAFEAGYKPRDIEVEYLGTLERATARAYFARKTDPSLLPYFWYNALVVAGAKAAKLPDVYVAQLKSVKTQTDEDLERHDKNMAIVNAV